MKKLNKTLAIAMVLLLFLMVASGFMYKIAEALDKTGLANIESFINHSRIPDNNIKP